MSAVDDYFAGLDEAAAAAFEHVRRLARRVAPDAVDGVGYGMAALRYRDKPLLGFKEATGHLSIFPFSPAAVDAVRDRLSGYSVSKGTIRFAAADPLPDDVVLDLVRHRMAEIEGR
jgi:uncharacterized protein YdhG (YjbR/CyaY superfamily)